MTWHALARAGVFAVYVASTAALAAVGLYYGLLAVERLLRDGGGPTTPGSAGSAGLTGQRVTQAVESADGPAVEPSAAGTGDGRPSVTVQIPVYNERHVVERVLAAVGDLSWPADRLQVQVIDDSTDDTSEVVTAALPALREQGIDVAHIRRDARDGYKAGAVDRGLRTATGEFVALFDADFVPPPDFLERTVGHFADTDVGCVQTRWAHLNEGYSWFTRAQALALDAHFAVEQWVRAEAGSLMSFNATSCVWRRETLDDVGGWSSETVAEDLDLTAAALVRGWEFVYTEGYAVPCEIPATLAGFVRQQTRWARGSTQNVRKHLRELLSTPALSGWARFYSVLHVLHYVFYPLLLGWLLLHVVVTLTVDVPSWVLVGGFLGTTPGPVAFLALGQALTDRPGRLRRLSSVVTLTLVGVGIAWRMSRAVVAGFLSMGGSFARTPKFGLDGPERTWRGQAYADGLGSLLPEFLLGAGCASGAALAVLTGAPRMAPSLAFFAVAFWTVVAFARWQR